MAEIVDVPLGNLLLDPENARLPESAASQHDITLALASQQQDKLVRLARDIVEHGLDPTALIAVVPTSDQHKRYHVMEGNRRVLALKALETPNLVAPVLSSRATKALTALADRYAANPVASVKCVLFETPREAEHWIELRHTGENSGFGLVEWGAEEKDRFAGRRAQRSPAGQIIDFVERHGSLSEEARTSRRRIITSLGRLISTQEVRDHLGIDVAEKTVVSNYPKEEIVRGLTRVVEDLRTGRTKVTDIYHLPQRLDYISTLPRSTRPRKRTRLDSPATLASLGTGTPKSPTTKKKTTRRRGGVGTSFIPRDCQLNVDPPRINQIFNELLNLSVEQYPNACSVLFRVFIELSVDHFLSEKKAMSEKDIHQLPLAKRLKGAADYMHKKGTMSAKLRTAVYKIADSRHVLSASTATLNQYVHNEYVYPKGSDLRAAWDEIQPVVERLWAK